MKLATAIMQTAMLALLASALLPITVWSIERGTAEFGVDGVFSITSFEAQSGFFGPGQDNLTELTFPSRVRFGTFTSEKAAVDFMFSFTSIHQGRADLTALDAHVGAGLHFSDRTEGSVGFFEPIAGIRLVSGGSSASLQFLVGGEVGVKSISSSGLATRLSGVIKHAFENDNFLGATTFGVNFGLSLLTKPRRGL